MNELLCLPVIGPVDNLCIIINALKRKAVRIHTRGGSNRHFETVGGKRRRITTSAFIVDERDRAVCSIWFAHDVCQNRNWSSLPKYIIVTPDIENIREDSKIFSQEDNWDHYDELCEIVSDPNSFIH